MPSLNLLYKREIAINDAIHIVVPTVGEILQDEDGYYGLITLLTSMPIDLMCQLDEIGIDFTSITDYDLFLLLFSGLQTQDTSLVFGDLDLSGFQTAISKQNGKIVLADTENDIVIDRAIYGRIAATLRKIHHLEKNRRKPANEEAKKYMLERARAKQKRRANRVEDSQLESLIISMVNTEQYKYNFESTLGLSIFQFNESVRQVIKKIDYDNRMHGVYAGTIDAKKLSQNDLTWLNCK